MAIVTDADGRRASPPHPHRGSLDWRRRRARGDRRAARRGLEELRRARDRCSRRCSRRGSSAATSVVALGGGVVGDLAGFAAGDRAPRHPLRADADDAARPGQFLGRRQDRHQHRATARTWSASSISRAWCSPTPASLDTLPPREFHAGYAEVAKYGLIGDAALLRLARGQLARRSSAGWPRARAGDRHRLPRQGRDRRRRRARERRSARCSISAIPSAMRSRPPPASRTGSSTARASSIGMVLAFGLSAKLGHCKPDDVTRRGRPPRRCRPADAHRRHPRRRASTPRR